ncbi:MAG: phosphoribosylglycinamide formyltransferase [Clostridia bacterium]|nr:phosphoribosylglycinamide formyltransferase [Clostridia bacterium]
MLNIAVLVSGGGTNLQALIDAEKAGKIKNGRISLVVASRPGVYALERAANAGIEGVVLARKEFSDVDAYSEALENLLKEKKTDLIVLAGFMTITNEKFTKAFENKIINVHPALIPSFCGKGFYGLHVHEAALARGVKLSGATVHFVNEVCDGGPIILQKAVSVENGDTPETLQRRIMEQAEWQLLPEAVSLFCEGRLEVNGAVVTILPPKA